MQPRTIKPMILASMLFPAVPLEPSCSYAASDDATNSIPMVIETAKQLCAAVSDAGSTQGAKVSGEVKAGLDGLLSRLTSLGVSMKAGADSSRYQGVLQSDLPIAIKDQNECRTRVFNKLLDTVFSEKVRGGTVQSEYVGYQPTGDFETELRYFMEVSGTRAAQKKQMESMITMLGNMFQKQFSIDNDTMFEIKEIMREEMPRFDDYLDDILPIWQKYYTVDELQELNKFYSTPAMREMVRNMPSVEKDLVPIETQIAQHVQQRVGERVQELVERVQKQHEPAH